MIRNHSHRDKRSAFTLVELMVVILIIAILVSLISSAVVKVMNKIPEVQTSTEIREMEVGLNAFMQDYGLADPPPSTLVLNELSPLSTPSAPFLQKVFGKNLGFGQPFVDWNGDGIPNGPWILEGEQCLVFYLGGIPTAPGVAGFAPQGFSTNNINPGTPSGKRKGPYFNFQTTRLIPVQTLYIGSLTPMPNPLVSSVHPAYIDSWQVKTTIHPTIAPFATHTAPLANGIPYAYFSSQGINNGYTLTDCANLVAAPYFTIPVVLTPQYTYPNRYQIISAGKDGTFGNSGWIPASGALAPGADDQANFSGSLLGAGQS